MTADHSWVDSLINVLLLLCALVAGIATTTGPTVTPDPKHIDDLPEIQPGGLRRRLRAWRQRIRPAGWVVLACIFAVFVLGVIKQIRADNRLRQTVEKSEKLEQMAARDRDQQSAPHSIGPIDVISTWESRYPDGRYFDFDAAALDRLLGRTDWDKHVYLVSKSAEKGFRRAVLRRTKEPKFGGARGRLLPTGKPGDWKDGESFYVVPKDYGPWDPREL
jgi:hypothetical protein